MFLSLFRKKVERAAEAEPEKPPEVVKDSMEVRDTIYGSRSCFSPSQSLKWCFLDVIRTIKDPEKPNTLEDLNVVYEEGITVSGMSQFFLGVEI